MKPVPSARLLSAVFGVALLATVAVPWPHLSSLWVLALLSVILLALADLALGIQADTTPAIGIPAILRFTKNRPSAIPVVFTNPSEKRCRLRFALALPPAIAPEKTDFWLEIATGVKHSRIDWKVIPTRRGRFTGVTACTEQRSKWGFWFLRQRRELACELRVYPNLFSERKQLAALFLSREQSGSKVLAMVGRGRDFEKLRDYLPGDDFDEIHWKATAKRGRPITKVFQAERTQEIYVIVDASRLSARPLVLEGTHQTALERYLTATLVLLLAAERQGDHFGLLVYDDRVRTFLRAGHGEGHYSACREALHTLEASDATPDMAEIVRYLRTQLRRRALLFFITDLSDPVLAEDVCRHIGLLSRQHLVSINQIRAPGVAPLFSTGTVREAAEIYAKLAGHERWLEAQALSKRLKPLGVSAHLLENETVAVQLVSQYLAVKRRQLL